MKRALSFLVFACVMCARADAQVAVTSDGSLPHASAMLDVQSTDKGVLVSRMTSAQRTSIVSPADGLLVYDTDTKTFWYRKNLVWTEINGLTLPYAATNNSAGSSFTINNGAAVPASAGRFNILNASNSASALFASTSGTGNAIQAEVSANTATALFGRATGTSTGASGVFTNDNAANTNITVGIFTNATSSNGLLSQTTGGGIAAKFVAINNTNTTPAVSIEKMGTGDGLRIENINGNGNNIGLNIRNGYIKVDQAASNRTVFVHTATAGNISGNITILSYPGMSSTDILIVTHNYTGFWIGALGTWWNGAAWTVFREDGSAMPAAEKFNIIVIKQ
jgi:hypothetical protein